MTASSYQYPGNNMYGLNSAEGYNSFNDLGDPSGAQSDFTDDSSLEDRHSTSPEAKVHLKLAPGPFHSRPWDYVLPLSSRTFLLGYTQ